MTKDREAALLLWGALEAIAPFLEAGKREGVGDVLVLVSGILWSTDEEKTNAD